MPETTPLIKAALNLRVGAGFDVYMQYITSYEHYGQKKAGVLPADGGPGSFDQPKDVTCHTHIL